MIKKVMQFYNTFYKKQDNAYKAKENKLSRDIWLQKTLSSIKPASRILDAGAGQLRNKKYCSHLDYVSQDFGEFTGDDPKAPGLGSCGHWDTSNVDIICDIIAIPEPSESFDVILCSEVFEHLPNPVAALQEFSRLLKPNGKLILTAPFNSLTHQAPYYFYSGFSQFFYEKWCSEFGFVIVELVANGNYFDYMVQELKRIPVTASTYANQKLNYWQKKSLKSVVSFLEQASYTDTASSEFLCFGYHLIAKKK